MTDTPDNVNNIQDIGPLGDSDHTMISVGFTGNAGAADTRKAIPDWSKSNMEELKNHLRQIDWRQALNGKTGHEMWDVFKNTIKARQDQCWMTSAIKKLLSRKRAAYNNRDLVEYKHW